MKIYQITEEELETRAREYSIVLLKKLYRKFKAKSLVFIKIARQKNNSHLLKRGITWEQAAQEVEKIMEPIGGLANEKSRIK